MKVLGIRFCTVTPEAKALAAFLDSLGMGRKDLGDALAAFGPDFFGAVFPAGRDSWVELWSPAPAMGMAEGVMLQVVVDDADAFAAHARGNGLTPEGPMDAHGERIYMLKAPGGLQMSFQSALAA